jgi:hypothetical protein
MRIIILFTVCVISVINVWAQNEINFSPKQLVKEINNQYKCDNTVLVDIANHSEIVIDTLNEKYLKIENNSTLIGYIYIGRVKTCRSGVCSTPDKFKNDSYEFFDYYILFDTMARILNVNIFNYEASHGHEITVKSWLKQFKGYDGKSELIVGKNIDAISGATISVHSITYDVSNKTEMLNEYIRK